MPIATTVTLIVYSWKSVEPGIMSWVFPSFAAAVHAAQAMTNAISWAIVAGHPFHSRMRTEVDLERVRAKGQVLLEESRG
jgi:hypothetical protein